MFVTAIRYWSRQSRRSSFRLLFVALLLAVAAISSVGIFSARLEAALEQNATQILGGDLVIKSKRDSSEANWQKLFKTPKFSSLKTAQGVIFPSVIPSTKTDLLVSLKAVSNTYPLRGTLLVQDREGKQTLVSHGPEQGEVWVDEGVPDSLGIALGQTVQVGQWSAPVTHLILREPDRGAGFINFAPRLMINIANLKATHLLGLGSRATWRAYVAGLPKTIEAFKAKIEPIMSTTDELESLEEGRPEVGGTLSRAKDFLAMAALIGTLVACVGIALIAHQFSSEQSREMAILKSLGYTPSVLLKLNLYGLGFLTLMAGGAGVLLGWLAHLALLGLLSNLIGIDLPMAGLYYLPFGVLLAGILVVGFAGVPCWYALQAPAVAVIRRQAVGSNRQKIVFSVCFGSFAAVAVCLLVVSNIKLALILCLSFVLSCAVFAGLFWCLLHLLAKLSETGKNKGVGLHVFNSMSKRSSMLILQGVSLSLGLSALLMLGVVQGDLINRWQAMIPAQAPNRFVFNIQPDQAAPILQSLNQQSPQPVRLYPMVRGRLTAINGRKIDAQTFTDDQAKRLVEREFNLSYTDSIPKNNQIQEGKWFDRNKTTSSQVSVEQSVMKNLGLHLGDKLTLDIAGTPLNAQITSVRKLRWDSMDVNFFMVLPGGSLQSFPQTWITSFYLPPTQASTVSRQLVRHYPNLTVLDTTQLIKQLRDILSQVSQAVQFVFLFTILAGGLVVIACVLTSSRARTREAAIYRALGASSLQLQKAAWLELTVVGALAGLLAALCAQALGWSIAHFIFEFDYVISLFNILVGLICGVIVSIVFGAWSIRKVCQTPVMQTLRQSAM